MNDRLLYLRVLVVFAALVFCAGAAEFPPFRMDEFDRSREQTYDGVVPDMFDVPKVAERTYVEDEEIARLPIEGVVIEGVVPFPDYGITQESIQELIDRRYREERDILLDDNGFTQRDYSDIGRFLREMIDRRTWDTEDLNNLVTLIDKGEFERTWITIEQLDSIALSVTEYYRERGFILATAFVPEQEVTDGIIRLNVLEGRLGNVTVSNNEVFSEEIISAAFDDELGQPVTEERIESALRRINDLPGVRVRGSFSPGQNVGETSLNLGVLDERSWTAALLLDNHGSETTGKTRLFATAEWLNFANRGHRLSVGVLRSEGPDSSTYGLVDYELPVTNDGRGRVRAGISTNQFSVASLADLPPIVGETNNAAVTGSYQIERSRTQNLAVQAGVTYKDVTFDVEGLQSLSTRQKIQVGSISTDYNRLWDEYQLLFSGRVGIDEGYILSGALDDQSRNFTKVLFTGNLLKRFSVFNWLTKDESFFNFVVRLNAQYSEKFLSSVEQFSLGGPNAVRAFGVSDVSVDSGAYAGFELFFDSPVDLPGMLNLPLEPLRPFVFFDYAYGNARSQATDANRDAQLKAYGLGLRLDWPGRGTANLIFAEPRSARYDDDFSPQVEGKARIFFDVRYQFR